MIALALALGIIVGFGLNQSMGFEFNLEYSQNISIVTDLFLRLIKMIIAPLIISTLVIGIAKMGDAKALGRIFSKTLFLFICASFISILLGLVIVNLFKPGVGINFIASDANALSNVVATPFSFKTFLTHAVPTSIVDAMAKNDILQIVIFLFLWESLSLQLVKKVNPLLNFLILLLL